MTAAHSPIQTLFWDIGGVLLTNGWDQTQRSEVLASLHVDLSAYEALHHEANFFWERGLMTARDFFQKTVLDAHPHLTFDQLWPLVCAQSRLLNPGCLDILSSLRSTGHLHVATLNNESRELNDFRLHTFDLRRYFDYFICSGYVHEMKPAPGIYRTALEISGLPAETALFIDDKEENCDAARSLGMQTIVFQSPSQLRQELAQRGVAIP